MNNHKSLMKPIHSFLLIRHIDRNVAFFPFLSLLTREKIHEYQGAESIEAVAGKRESAAEEKPD